MSIKEVAKAAGVSPSTVSRVVNGGNLTAASKETQEKIWEAVRLLGYSPNHHARSLKKPGEVRGPKAEIDCVYARKVGPFLDPFFATLMHAAEVELTRMGYILRYYYSIEDIEINVITRARSGPSAAIVLGRPHKAALNLLQEKYTNIVYSGLNLLSGEIDQVLCSGYGAAEACVEHLISLGHTKICYLGEIFKEQRYQGYCDTMRRYGLLDEAQYVIETPFTPAGAYDAVNAFLELNREFTAIFCANDMSAMGVFKALKEHKLKVPRDVSVIGINDMEAVRYLDPMLTTINIPMEEMGKMVAKLLVDRIEGGHRLPAKVEIPFSLICRDSCGPVLKRVSGAK